MAKRRRRKADQDQTLPGMEDTRHADLDEAIRVYVDARNERMACTETEVETKKAVVDLMKQHKLKIYKCDGQTATVTKAEAIDKLKVKTDKPDED